jgi:hypothetical protein
MKVFMFIKRKAGDDPDARVEAVICTAQDMKADCPQGDWDT